MDEFLLQKFFGLWVIVWSECLIYSSLMFLFYELSVVTDIDYFPVKV